MSRAQNSAGPVCEFEGPTHTLIPQQGEEIREQERLAPIRIFTTPKGETVADFGQNVTGYVEIHLTAKAGETVELSHAEVLDKEGCFYTENYRTAKAQYLYICRDGQQSYKPKLTSLVSAIYGSTVFPEARLPQNRKISQQL